MANPEHVEIAKRGADAIRSWRRENPGVKFKLDGANLEGVNLDGANLFGADLSGAHLTYVSLRKALLKLANLNGADLGGANLGEAYLAEVNLSRANLTSVNLSRAHMLEVRGVEHAYALETAKLTPMDNPQASASGADAVSFETCRRRWPERWLDWERLRVVGRLPLFGMSYTALLLIPIVFYGLALYNDKIDLVRAWAEQAVTSPDHQLHRLAPLILERLHRRPIPSLSFVLLVSTVLLAVGSSLYTAFCPSRIKEFSRDQWCDQLGRSLLHYWPLAWKHRYIRLVSATCYVLGGFGAAWVLGWKVWHTALFILKHSTFPWSWL